MSTNEEIIKSLFNAALKLETRGAAILPSNARNHCAGRTAITGINLSS
jgi:hypothetical protein